MSGRRPLKGGAVRLLGNHHGEAGVAFRRCYDAVSLELGPLSALAKLEASRVAAAWVQLQAATRALVAAQRERKTGRGRRPGARDIERLARRQGLADSSFSQALDKLRAMVGDRPAPDLARQLAAAASRREGTNGAR
jgi:hypothetical protein